MTERASGPGQDPAHARAAMVADQLRTRGITDERVLAAMGAIPREAFVPASLRRVAYSDEALPIEAGQTISQPYMVATMTQHLAVRPGDRILEIGAGSGYQAAILAWLGAHVTSLERQAALIPSARARIAAVLPSAPLGPSAAVGPGAPPGPGAALAPNDAPAENQALGPDPTGSVEIREGDGSLGDPDGAPWDGIIVTAAAPSIPDALREQLGDGGRLVIPVGARDRQLLTIVTRHGDEWMERTDGYCIFVPLIGPGGFER